MDGVDWGEIEARALTQECRRKALALMRVYYTSTEDEFVTAFQAAWREAPYDVCVGFTMLTEFLLGASAKKLGTTPGKLVDVMLELVEDG